MKISAEIKCTILAISIEKDLRNWIKSELLNTNKLSNLVDQNLFNRLKIKCENIDDDEELINGADFGECYNLLNQHKNLLTSDSKIIFDELNNSLLLIKKVRDRSAHKNLLASDIDEMETFINYISNYKNIFVTFFLELEKLSSGRFDEEYVLDEELEIDNEIDNNLPSTEHQETGFIRRDKLIKKIDQTIKKNSVIVLTGDAGVGKTSILLHKCNEIKIQLGEYDEIKWFTFKTQTFSNNEIKELNKSFISYKQFLNTFSEDLDENNQIKFLLDYLTKKKCLLILDNLETVLDQNIVNFIEESHEVEHNSKIIITSREPIDSGVTIKIPALDDLGAESLFRKYSQYLDLDFLQKMRRQEIINLVNRRDNNPLGIKLSLDDVFNGTRIDKAFEASKDFLNYSYNSLFLKLENNSKKILEMLFYLEQEFTLTTICTYTGLEPSLVEINLSDLDRKRFLIRDIKDSGTEYFSLRPIIKSFIQKNNLFKDLESKKKILQIDARLKTTKSTRKINVNNITQIRYDYDSFLKRKDSDDEAIDELLFINKYLIRRQRLITLSMKNPNSKDNEKTLNEINLEDQQLIKTFSFLKKKHPNFCEIYRVEGIFYGYLGSIQDMKSSFEYAIKLQPDYPNLRAYHIQILRLCSQYEDSIKVGLNAYELFPEFIEIHYQLLQSLYYLRKFDQMTKDLAKKNEIGAIDFKDIDLRFARKLAKCSLEYYRRHAEYLISRGSHDDFILAYDEMYSLAELFKKFEDLNLVDYKTTMTTIKKGFGELVKLRNYFSQDKRHQFINGLITVFNQKLDQYTSNQGSEIKQKFLEKFDTLKIGGKKIFKRGDTATGIYIGARGRITSKVGGYIKVIDGIFKDYDNSYREQIFIHSSQGIENIKPGSKISFKFDDYNGFTRKSLVATEPKII